MSERLYPSISAGSGDELTLTTQAAERIYRARTGEQGEIRTRLHIASAARLNWLPQETILFDGSNLNRSLQVDMAEDARFLMVEPLVFARGDLLRTWSL